MSGPTGEQGRHTTSATVDATASRPYEQAAHAYLRSGLGSPVPLGRIGSGPVKEPPLAGWTGGTNPDASGADAQAWIEDGYGAQNIALRLAVGVVVTDVDSYKGPGGRASTDEERASILAGFAALGLPPTVTSTSRGADSPDRHHVFRYDPADMAGRVFKNPCGSNGGVDILHHGWRYMMAAPSLHPDRGTVVRWYAVDGTPIDGAPHVSDLPMLTREQVHLLSKPGVTSEKAQLGDEESLSWLGLAREGGMCAPVRAKLAATMAELATPGARRHDTANDGTLALVRYAGQGHKGTVTALLALRDEYFKVTAAEKRDTVGEWARGLHGAVAIVVKDTPRPAITCVCEPPLPGYFTLPEGLGRAKSDDEQHEGAEPDMGDGFDLDVELKAVEAAEGDARVLAAFAMVRKLVGADAETEALVFQRLKKIRGVDLMPLRLALKEAREGLAGAEREKRAAEHAKKRDELKEKGGLLPAPRKPMAVARELAARLPGGSGETPCPHLLAWRGDWYFWQGTHWRPTVDEVVRDSVYTEAEHAFFEAGTPEEPEMISWNPNSAKVNNVVDALGTVLRRPATEEAELAIACTNGVLDLVTGRLHAHEPQRFNLNALPYAYDPAASCPRWLEFLDAVLPGDAQAHEFLQEWFGYLISGETRQQKIACLVGKKRGGKGTIARVLTAVLGEANVTGATLNSIAGTFGLEPLVGKSLALLPDVSWKVRNAAESAELLKMISGEDAPPVHRKNRTAWEGRLRVRFTIMTNDTPTFKDASGALADRLIMVRFKQTFLGREDVGLTDRLLTELPGVLNWALHGLMRLRERGRFIEPASSAETREEVYRNSSKLYGFLEDETIESEAAAEVELHDLYEAYLAWCQDEKRDYEVALTNFTRELHDAGVETRRSKAKRKDGRTDRPAKPTYVLGRAPRDGAWRKPNPADPGRYIASGKVSTPGHFSA